MNNFLNQISMVAIALLFVTTSCNNTPVENTTESADEATISNENTIINTDTDTLKTAVGTDKIFSIKTSVGVIKVKLYKECPLHQTNFSKLVFESFYDGILFHRVIKGFMIQTGDPDSKAAVAGAQYGSGGPGYTIPAEINANFHHKKGALAAARQGNEVNPYKASSGSQFYICEGRVMTKDQLMQMGKPFSNQAINDYTTIGGTPELDGEYTVFGEVLTGLDVMEKIANTPTLPNERPKKDIKIISIKLDLE